MQLTGMDVAVYGFKYQKHIEAAGIAYELGIVRDLLALGRSTEPVLRFSSFTGNKFSTIQHEQVVNDWLNLNGEDYLKFLKSLDPSDCKNQDHYKVLGLADLRWQASPAQIRSAYRAIVLKYHPDKCKNSRIVDEVLEEDYFTCITKAYEQLGFSEQKRRAYDSVDPSFDDTIPDEAQVNEKNFYELLDPVFRRNSRWSRKQPVPMIGDDKSSIDGINEFYQFWFSWDSWREFSYLDEEDKEKGEDRYERREIEKINKVERERRRKNETQRVMNLVEMAFQKDPRLALFKQQERLKRENEKLERKKIADEKRAEEARIKKEIELQNQKEMEERLQREKRQRIAEKKVKEQQKKQLKEACKSLRHIVQEKKHWGSSSGAYLACIEAVERICLRSTSKRINEIVESLQAITTYEEAMDLLLVDEIAKEKEALELKNGSTADTKKSVTYWTSDELALIVKATSLYPAGTLNRWTEVSNYINEHRTNKGSNKKTEKDVVAQAKVLKAMKIRSTQGKPNGSLSVVNDCDTDWTSDEQKLFEAALKKFSSSEVNRWDRIAEYVGRNKKDCIKRFKYLADLIKSRKAQVH